MKCTCPSFRFGIATRVVALCAVLALMTSEHEADAATFCIMSGDVAGLESAINTAQTDGEDDDIQLQSGTYALAGADLVYSPDTEQHDLTIEGGYAEFFGNSCGLAPSSPDADATILTGGQVKFAMPHGDGSINLRGITLENMVVPMQNEVSISVGGFGDSTGAVVVDNVKFLDNVSSTPAVIFLSPGAGSMSIRNSLFARNVAAMGFSYVELDGFDPNADLCIEVVNSTFVTNPSTGVRLTTPTCLSILANDIFWGHSGNFYADSPALAYLMEDDFFNPTDAANTHATDLISLDPLFNADFSLADYSLLRNRGSDGGFGYTPGDFDVVGNPRIYDAGQPGSHADIGAYEIQDVIFASALDQTPQ